MAQVTVELRNLLQTDFELFDFDYQFDDPIFKKELEEHVIQYFWDYEIGQETPDMFKRKFKARWLRIIGYYNSLYNTTLLQYNPLTNYSMNEAMEQLSQSKTSQSTTRLTNAETTVDSAAQSTTNEKSSDYPQQSIQEADYLSGERLITSNDEADSTTNTESRGEDQLTGESEGESSYQKTIEGITGITYQELIRQQRKLIIRIPDLVCEDLKPCFVLVY